MKLVKNNIYNDDYICVKVSLNNLNWYVHVTASKKYRQREHFLMDEAIFFITKVIWN